MIALKRNGIVYVQNSTINHLKFLKNKYNLSKFDNFNELQVDAKKANVSENDKNSESNVVKNDANDDEKGKFE